MFHHVPTIYQLHPVQSLLVLASLAFRLKPKSWKNWPGMDAVSGHALRPLQGDLRLLMHPNKKPPVAERADLLLLGLGSIDIVRLF
jgi:hypothetical protein